MQSTLLTPDNKSLRYQPISEVDRVVRAVCSPNCTGTCGVMAHVKDERIVRLEPATFPDPGFERICLRGIAMATQRLHHPDRLTHPMIRSGPRGSGQWRKVSWDEANDYIVEKLKCVQSQWGPRANSWLSASGNYGVRSYTAAQRIAHTLKGTTFTSLALSGDFAGAVGLINTIGTPGGANEISEIGHARYMLSVGNIVDTAHCEMHFVFDAMEKGMKLVTIDPRHSRTAAKADEWVAVRPGSDIALVLGLIHVIVRDGLMDEDYLRLYTNAPYLVRLDNGALLRERDLVANGGDSCMVWGPEGPVTIELSVASKLEPALRGRWTANGVNDSPIACQTGFEASWAVWRHYTPESASLKCDVPAEQIERVARDYATLSPAWIMLGPGSQRYHHGHLTHRAYATMAALCGNIGKAYAGVNTLDAPLTSMLFGAPESWLMPGGSRGQVQPGTRLVEIIRDGAPYPVKSLWINGIGLGPQTPMFKRFIEEALPKLDLFVVSEQLLTDAARYADIVLPVVSYYEDDWDLIGGATNWFMQLRRRAVAPVGESRSDSDIYKVVAERMGMGEHWQDSPEQSCLNFLQQHPDPRIRAVDWDTLKRDGVARVPLQRPYVPFGDMRFPTPSGRIEIYQEMFASLDEAVLDHKSPLEVVDVRYPLRLITYKHVYSTHSQHTTLPAIQELLGKPRLEMAPTEAASRGIAEGDLVEVYNDRGKFRLPATMSPKAQLGMVCLPEGFWQRHFEGGHPSDLGHIPESMVQSKILETNYPVWDVVCEVRKMEGQQ